MTTVIIKKTANVGTTGHIDHGALRLAVMRLNAAMPTIAEAAYAFKRASECLRMVAPDPVQEYVAPKPQPFWTQRGRRKKGGRSKY